MRIDPTGKLMERDQQWKRYAYMFSVLDLKVVFDSVYTASCFVQLHVFSLQKIKSELKGLSNGFHCIKETKKYAVVM